MAAGRWYFGWNIVAASAVLTLVSSGMRLGVGPFFLPVAHDLALSRSTLAGIVAIGMICYGLAMPVAGQLIARRGTRFVVLLGTVLVAASCIAAAMAQGRWRSASRSACCCRSGSGSSAPSPSRP